jgi:gliding motility-associated-like protein
MSISKKNNTNSYLKIFLFVLFISFSFISISQLTIINSKSPSQLVSDILIGPGVNVSNITFKGDKTIGISEFFYTNVPGSNNLGLDKGVFLSTGNVQNAAGKNISQSTGSQGSNISDNDLDSIIKKTGKKTTDATVIEFDFVPMSDSIQFKYVFASEEYPEFNCSSFNDVFAFLLSGPDPNGGPSFTNKNLAIVPGTTNTNVSVNTINSGTVSGNNSETICNNIDPNWKNYTPFFVSNFPNIPQSDQITFDGYTVPLVAKAAVKCGETYHMKIAVADVGDQNYDSGVFLLANSLFSNIISAETKEQKNDLSIISDSIMVENCSKGILTFKLGKKSTQNTIINYTLKGTATNGVDYQNLSGSITIPANQDSIQLIINPLSDNISENEETLIFEYNAGGCAGTQTKTFVIRDTPMPPVTDFSYDSIICLNSGDEFVVRASGFVKGGTFSSNSTDINLNTTTGKISPSLSKPGIYQITYKVSPTNACEVAGQSTINIEIKDMQDPITTFSYPSPICQSNSTVDPNLVQNFTTGGKFYSKTKISVDSTSGKINLATTDPGIHKVYYLHLKNECYNQKLDSTTIEIIANPSPIPGFSYPSPLCKIDANPTPSLANGFVSGGVFKTDSVKLVFKNTTTGEIDLNLTPIGTYNIYYEVKNNSNCTVTTNTTFITIVDQTIPKIGFKYDSILCTGSGKKLPILIMPFTNGGKFSSSNLSLKIDTLTGEIDLNNSLKGNYLVKYSFPATNCNNAKDTTISIVIDSLIQKNTTFSYTSPICITGSNPLPSGNYDLGGEFTAPQGVTISKANGRINLAGTVAGTYDITYTIQASGCYAKSIGTASITIESSNAPVVNFSYERPICLNSENTSPILPNGFTKGGVFSTLETEITVNDSTGKLDLSKAIGGKTYTVDYKILSSACGGTGTGTTEILIADLSNPDTDFNYGDSLFCVNTPKLSPVKSNTFEEGGVFKSLSNGILIDSITGEINFVNSQTGIYQIMYYTPEKSCVAADTTIKNVTISKLPVVSIVTNNPICIGDTLKLKGPSYTNAKYEWKGPNNFSSSDSLNILAPLTINEKGVYKLLITKNNCIDSTEIDVDIKDLENIPITSVGPFCKSDTNLYKIKASAPNGIWNDTTLILDKSDSSIVYFRPSNSNLDSLVLTYTTEKGCGGIGTTKIINNSLPITNFDINSKEGCAPVSVKLLLPASSKLDSCHWYIDDELIKISKDSTIKFSKQGYFNVKVESFKNGCFSSLQKDTILKVYPYPIADFTIKDTVLSIFTPIVNLTNTSTNATKYNWFFSDGFTSTSTNPTHKFPLESTDYFITLYASQRGFCEDSKTIHITIPIDLTVYVPNTFTPNDDDLNEEFLPIISNAIDPSSYTLTIFNRWGEIVFISHDKSIGWRGTYGGNVCIDGVYTWKIDFIDSIKSKKHYYVGHVTLLK